MHPNIAEKEDEAGRKLNVNEREYLCLLVERRRYLQISSSERGQEDKRRYNAIRSQMTKLTKLQPMEDFLKMTTKTAAERKRISRAKMSDEAKEKERVEKRRHMASLREKK